ncbi:MAG: hypothetical protein WCD26_24155 [Pseudolabrys sp.]
MAEGIIAITRRALCNSAPDRTMIRGPLQTLPQATAASATALVASNAQHVELADQITEYGRAVAGHFSSSVARSSVAAGKRFLQRLDGEKPDVFCHATQLMHGADSLPVGQRVRFDLASNVRRAARLTPLNAVDRMYVAARGFQPRGKPNHQQRYCVEHIARGTPQLSPSRRMARRAEPWCVSDT